MRTALTERAFARSMCAERAATFLAERAFARRGSGRRNSLRGGGGGGPRRMVYGLSSWDASTALATATGAGTAGSAVTGVSGIVVWSVGQVPTGTQNWFGRGIASNTGWIMRSNNATVQMICGNGAVSATAPTRTIVAGDVGKLQITALSCDIAAVFQYSNAAQVGTNTALAGYSPTAATQRTCIGSSASGVAAAVDYTIYSVCSRDSHLTLADFQTICAATKAQNNGRIALGGITMDHQWNAPASATVPATLSDQIGADTMSFVVGSEANLVSAAVPLVWAF